MKKFLLALAFVFALAAVTAPKAHAYIPPGCIAEPIDVTPISAPYQCSRSALSVECQRFSGLCLTSDGGVWYQVVYWITEFMCDPYANGTPCSKGNDGD